MTRAGILLTLMVCLTGCGGLSYDNYAYYKNKYGKGLIITDDVKLKVNESYIRINKISNGMDFGYDYKRDIILFRFKADF